MNSRLTAKMADPADIPDGPLVGVSIAVWRNEKVLLVERGKDPLKGLWSLPGGRVHKGEKLQEAASRELMEETGISAENLGMVDVVEVIQQADGIAVHFVIAVFAGKWTCGEPVAASDASDAKWYALKDMSELEMTRGTEAVIDKSRAFLKNS